MPCLSNKVKLHLLVLLPLMIVTVISSLCLYITESHLLLAFNLISFGFVSTISLHYIEKMTVKMEKERKDLSKEIETIRYSSDLLSSEILRTEIQDVDVLIHEIHDIKMDILSTDVIQADFQDIYDRMKNLLMTIVKESQGTKESLSYARELSKLCELQGKQSNALKLLVSSSLVKTQHLSNLTEKDNDLKKILHKALILSDGLKVCSVRMREYIPEDPVQERKTHSQVHPLNTSSLRKAIKLAEKKAA